MSIDLPLRCTCGRLRGVVRDVSPRTVNRVVCCCQGCQGYAHRLGRAAEILDEHGGTHVFQASPGRFAITEGEEYLACLQQTEKGALRWFASCCDSPIANTLPSMQMPFLAIVETVVDRSQLDASIDDLLGPVLVRVNGRFPRALARRLRATRWALVKMLARYGPMLLMWRLRGAHKASPLFDPSTGRPVREPRRTEPMTAN